MPIEKNSSADMSRAHFAVTKTAMLTPAAWVRRRYAKYLDELQKVEIFALSFSLSLGQPSFLTHWLSYSLSLSYPFFLSTTPHSFSHSLTLTFSLSLSLILTFSLTHSLLLCYFLSPSFTHSLLLSELSHCIHDSYKLSKLNKAQLCWNTLVNTRRCIIFGVLPYRRSSA